MKGHYVALPLLTFHLAAGMVACSLPLSLTTDETPRTEMTPLATEESSPTSPPTDTPSPHTPAPTVLSQADYQVVHEVQLTNTGPGLADRVTLWVALIRSLDPYQEVLDSHVQPPDFEVEEDEYGNRYARFEFHNVGADESVEATLTYQVRVSELTYDLSLCQGEMPDVFLEPEANLEVDDPRIQNLAQELSQGQTNPCETLRALYEYVGDNINYSSYTAGDRGALRALEQGSGDCTEFADVLLALSRAAGIPARFLEGVTYREGERSELGQIKHDWLEAYLPGPGWVPLDPTWGRFPHKRDDHFARISPDHVIVTVGRNLSILGGYHYFYYKWYGDDVHISHDERWQVAARQ